MRELDSDCGLLSESGISEEIIRMYTFVHITEALWEVEASLNRL